MHKTVYGTHFTDHIAVCDNCGFEQRNNSGYWPGPTYDSGNFMYPIGWTVEQQHTNKTWLYPSYCPTCTAQRQPQPTCPKRSI